MSLPEPDWQIQLNGQEYGPYNRARILEMLSRRELPDTAAIRQQGMADWLPVPTARQLLQAHVAGGGSLAEAPPEQAPEPAGEAGGTEQEPTEESAEEHVDDAVDFAPPPPAAPATPAAPAAAGTPGNPAAPGAQDPALEIPPESPKRRRRSTAPFIYAGVALVVLVAAWCYFNREVPTGRAGYAQFKADLVERMDAWRDHQIRLESVRASDVDGALVSYTIDEPARLVGDNDTEFTFVVHCQFRKDNGMPSEGKVTVTMGAKRLRLWNLLSK